MYVHFIFQILEASIINDSNNNIPKTNISPSTEIVEEAAVVNEAGKVATVSSLSNQRRDDFKCTVCHQVCCLVTLHSFRQPCLTWYLIMMGFITDKKGVL